MDDKLQEILVEPECAVPSTPCFSDMNFLDMPIDELVELYDLFNVIFHCPHGQFHEGESFLDYFVSTSTDMMCHQKRLREWVQLRSPILLDFDEIATRERVLKLRRHLYRFTRGAKRVAKKTTAMTNKRLHSGSDPETKGMINLDDCFDEDDDTSEFYTTKELITTAMAFKLKQRASRSETTLPLPETQNVSVTEMTSEQSACAAETTTEQPTKKRKRNRQRVVDEVPPNFLGEPFRLKPLLIFDLNKVLVWRRKKSMYFVIRPHAIEVTLHNVHLFAN